MPASTTGLARITIRAPRRRLDLSVPHLVPLAELLPDLLRHAGELTPSPPGLVAESLPADGWMLRRGDGAALAGDVALLTQGVQDGDVLYLVPRKVTWPEPAYDDLVDEIAIGTRTRTRPWDATATRAFALAAAGCLLLVGLGLLIGLGGVGLGADHHIGAGPGLAARGLVGSELVGGLAGLSVAIVLLGCGAIATRVVGDSMSGVAAAGFSLPYAAVGAALLLGAASPALAVSRAQGFGTATALAGAVALVSFSVLGAAVVGTGARVFTAGATAGLIAAIGAGVGLATTAPGAAAVALVLSVAAIGVAPAAVVRVARVPRPVVSASPEALAAEPRPDRADLHAAAQRANAMLAGVTTGIGGLAVACVVLLAGSGGTAGLVLSGLASTALVIRARLFPAVNTRLPLLCAGLTGSAVVTWLGLARGGTLASLTGVVVVLGAAIGLLLLAAATAKSASPTPAAGASAGPRSPYLVRLVDLVDVAVVVGLVPTACAVLDLYGWVRHLVG